MTKMKTIDELWDEVEMWFDGIEATLSHRCYQSHSAVGIRHIQLQIRQHLAWIDQALLTIEVLEARAAKENNGE